MYVIYLCMAGLMNVRAYVCMLHEYVMYVCMYVSCSPKPNDKGVKVMI